MGRGNAGSPLMAQGVCQRDETLAQVPNRSKADGPGVLSTYRNNEQTVGSHPVRRLGIAPVCGSRATRTGTDSREASERAEPATV